MGWSKLTDMELDDEAKLDAYPIIGPDGKNRGPEYPYGLRISLTEKELAKLDLDVADADVGDLVDIRALGVITSISQDEGSNGKTARVEIQLQKLALDDED
jgi:hypothetical protein